MSTNQFWTLDYVICIILLAWSMGIGLYFAVKSSKRKSIKEYLYGKGNFNGISVGISLYSGLMSSVSMIGNPTEVYLFGSQLLLTVISAIATVFFVWNFILPIFNQDLKINTPYEYFEMRFNKVVRKISTIVFLVFIVIYLPLVLYAACLTMAAATNLNITICTAITGGICTFYTLLGGYSSVVWTDVLQATLMMVSYATIVVLSVFKSGGIEEIWMKAGRGGRLNFVNWDPNPFQRLNVWVLLSGLFLSYSGHMGCSPSALQRFLSLKTEKQTRLSILVAMLGIVYLIITGTIFGWSMYAFYEGCDLVQNKTLSNYNQQTVAFAFNVIENIPGLSGLFIAGLLSAGLSTMSAELNTVSGIIYYDFIQPYFNNVKENKNGYLIMKIIVLIFGVYCTLMAPVMSKIQYLQHIIFVLTGIVNGYKLSFLILGTAFPRITSTGALTGVLISLSCILWIAIGASYYDVASLFTLPLSTEKCTNVNTMSHSILNQTLKEVFVPPLIYKLSPLSYITIILLLSIMISHLVCLKTGFNDVDKMDPRLMIPFVRPRNINNNKFELEIMLEKQINNS